MDQSPEADDLRQNSPFAGLLSEPERRRILREVVQLRLEQFEHVVAATAT